MGYKLGTQKGTVKWFDSTKGVGFIQAEEGFDVFVHLTNIVPIKGNLIPLEAEQKVIFEVVEGKRGPQAANVKVLEA